jgi:outer membrane protein
MRATANVLAASLVFFASNVSGEVPTELSQAAFNLRDMATRAFSIDGSINAAVHANTVAAEKLSQARAQQLPSLSWTVSRQSNRVIDAEVVQAPLQDGFNTQSSIQISQPIFRPQNVTSVQQAGAGLEAAALQIQSAKSDLLARLVGAAMDFFNSWEQQHWTRSHLIALNEHLSQVRRSFAVGIVSITDVREVEAKLGSARALAEAADFEVFAKKGVLQELTGQEINLDTYGFDFAGQAKLPTLKVDQLAGYLERIDSMQPLVLFAKRQVDVSNFETKRMKQAFAPTLDLTASRTQIHGRATTLYASSETISTQAALTLTVPLFSGGSQMSKVREASAAADKMRSEFDVVRQTARTNARQAFFSSLSSTSQVQALRSSAIFAETALKFNTRGYQIGVKTNLDVLNAQSQLFQAKRDLAKSIFESWLQYFKLINSTGSIELEDIDILQMQLLHNREVKTP